MTQGRSSRQTMRTRRSDSATFARIAPGAPFLSQILLGKDATGAPRHSPAAPEGTAAGAYALTSARAVRRMPPGYRTTREV